MLQFDGTNAEGYVSPLRNYMQLFKMTARSQVAEV